MPQFKRARKGSVRVQLDADESRILRELTLQLRAVLDAGDSNDPSHRRLYPDAYERPDDERAYRQLVGDQLEAIKKESLERVLERIGDGAVDAVLDAEQCESWLTVLTDLRLALGTRLDITEDQMNAELDPDDPAAGSMAVLHWLGWLQESLLEAMR